MKKSRFYYTRPPMLIQAYVNTIEEHIVPTNKVIKKWPQYTLYVEHLTMKLMSCP